MAPATTTRDICRDFVIQVVHQSTDWYNNRRLHSQLNYITPDKYEAAYYAQT